jgi:hypothetical protein
LASANSTSLEAKSRGSTDALIKGNSVDHCLDLGRTPSWPLLFAVGHLLEALVWRRRTAGSAYVRAGVKSNATHTVGTPLTHLSLVNFVPLEMKRRGVEVKMVLDGDKTPTRVDLPLLKAVARARQWSDDLLSGRIESVDALAKREGLDKRSVRRLIRLGFLSPRIVEAIAEGRQLPDLTVLSLTRRIDLPLFWIAQEKALDIS